MSSFVRGFCPMGCGETLFIGQGGYITCSVLHCPRPDAVADILGTRETGHLVEVTAAAYSILHPLRERLDNALLTCPLPAYLDAQSGPPGAPGSYRAQADGNGGWRWELIEAHPATQPAAAEPVDTPVDVAADVAAAAGGPG